MANKNAISPYNRLLAEAKRFIYSVKYRTTKLMFNGMHKDGNYTWVEIYQRMKAAEQLGYETLIVPDEKEGYFKIIYREKFPEIPMTFKY